jgi:hypothetical protein
MVYVEIPKPARVELKCSQNLAEGFDVILATPFNNDVIPTGDRLAIQFGTILVAV